MQNVTRMKVKRIIYISLGSLTTVILLAAIAIVWAYQTVENAAEGQIYTDTSTIPHNKAGLLLGTSKTVRSGRPNQYFQNRIAAAVSLYKAGKIEAIVISGDNGRHTYNEPEDMKAELVAGGVPEEKIFLDYAGFRTLDSVVRMDKIFGQQSFTVISQDFHNRRALYIAQAKGLKAIGFNAQDVSAYYGFKTQLREKLARVKLFLDLWTNKSPKFLGEPVPIE